MPISYLPDPPGAQAEVSCTLSLILISCNSEEACGSPQQHSRQSTLCLGPTCLIHQRPSQQSIGLQDPKNIQEHSSHRYQSWEGASFMVSIFVLKSLTDFLRISALGNLVNTKDSQMDKDQQKNTINKSKGYMAPSEPRCPTTASPWYTNTTTAQEDDLKSKLIKEIEAFKEKVP